MHPMPDYELVAKRYELCPNFSTGLSVKYLFNNRCKVGQQAGSYDPITKRSFIRIKGKNYKCSRIVYYLATKQDPGEYEIDHIDQDPSNNSIENLRLATRKDNAINIKIKKNNSTGFKGVSWHKSKSLFRCTINLNGVSKQISHHICPARLAYDYNLFALKHHGKFASINTDLKLSCKR
jgi:hypothetical protein